MNSDIPKRMRKYRPSPHLKREDMLEVTLELLDEVGFEHLTLRKLAAKLGVKAAALYWHFENKQDLIDQLADTIFAKEFPPTETANADLSSLGVREMFANMAYRMRRALHTYRDGAMVVAHGDFSRNKTFQGRDNMVAEMIKRDIPLEIVFPARFAIIRYTLGYVFESQTDAGNLLSAGIERDASWQKLSSNYPEALEQIKKYRRNMEQDPDYQFELGLQLILDGVEKKLTAWKAKSATIKR